MVLHLTRHDKDRRSRLLPQFQEYLSGNMHSNTSSDPYAIHAVLLQLVTTLYDESIWAFRDLLRGLEVVCRVGYLKGQY